MNDGSAFLEGPGGVAAFDQLQAAAVARLLACDSFVVAVGVVDDDAPFGIALDVAAAVRTPFPPHFLTQVTRRVADLPLNAMTDLLAGDQL